MDEFLDTSFLWYLPYFFDVSGEYDKGFEVVVEGVDETVFHKLSLWRVVQEDGSNRILRLVTIVWVVHASENGLSCCFVP